VTFVDIRIIKDEKDLDLKNARGTDVIVHQGLAKHFVDPELLEHHKAHAKFRRETIVVLDCARGDEICWRAKVPFSIVAMEAQEPDHNPSPGPPALSLEELEELKKKDLHAYSEALELTRAPKSCFAWESPIDSTNNEIHSGAPIVSPAPGTKWRYKVTFKIGDELIDPDFDPVP
jgi:hypothetical protein